jgi:hypothetical protein
MMQVLPETGAAYGYSEKDLRDPEKNLEAGLKNLKEALAYANNKPKLAAIYYHSGPDEIKEQAAGKPLGPNALEYVQKLKEFGTFDAFNPDFKASAESQASQGENPPPEAPPEPPAVSLGDAKILTPEQDFIRKNSSADLRRQLYGYVGAGTGAAIGVAPYVGTTAASTLGKMTKAFNEARQPAPAAPTTPAAPTGGLPTGGAPTSAQTPPGAPAGGLPNPQLQPPMGPADAGRMAQGQTGVIPYNTAKALGLTDIEAGQALTNTKQEGGAWDLAEKRREAMNRVNSMSGNKFVENPMYGGLLTQAPSVGGGVRVDPTTGAPQSFAMRVPEGGQAAELSVIPKAPTISTTPPPPPLPSGLDQVKSIFTNMMKFGSKAFPYVAPPLAGLSIGRDLADIQTQYERAPMERDFTDMGLSLASALATGATLTPAFPIAAPLSIGIPTYRNIRRNVLAQESDPELQRRNKMEPTAEEIEMANRPFIGYPRIR